MNETRNENNPKKANVGQDQFKSTKKWNEIIETFYSDMPLKRHWKNFRTFNDCFTASEAIDWTYRYLKSSPNFQHLTITKTNALKLLQIFLKERIIEDVRAGENYSLKEFQDDDRIYKFCTTHPIFLKQNSLNFNKKNLNDNTADKQSDKNSSKNDKSPNETQNTSKLQSDSSSLKRDTFLNSTSFENLSNSNKNLIHKRSTNSLVKSNDIFKKDSNDDLFIKNTVELELWSKSARKILESALRKAYLHKNSLKIDKNSINGSEFENSDCLVTPKLSSTLKRSNDIKIGLTNILTKRSCDIILKISGSNIEHNMNNINKHGVVINTADDLPVWVIRAMHTLLNWKSDNNTEYPKFSDVFEEIAQYFSSMSEPLLTTDLSYVFMEVLNFMLAKSSQILEQNKPEELNFENSAKKTFFCLNYRILDMIVSSFEQILTEANLNYDTDFLIDNIEKHLLENARLNIFEEPDDDYVLYEQTEILKYREDIYYNLLIDSLARLENCCPNCKNIYKEINQFINKNQSHNCQTTTHNPNSSNDESSKRLKSDFSESILESIHSSKTRLHRNNSFKAAIGDKTNSSESNDEFTMPKKPFVVRTSTNTSNDFNFVRSFLRKSDIILDNECENFDLISHDDKTKSLLQVQNNMDICDKSDNFKPSSMTKSISNQNICALESPRLPRKRKLSSDESNVEQLAMIFGDLSNTDNKKRQIRQPKLTSSLSLSYFNKDHAENRPLSSSISLQFVTNKNDVKKNLNDLNLFIKKSLNRHIDKNDNLLEKNDQESQPQLQLNTTKEVHSEIFDCLITSFRLLAVMLPPSNKRKLHFLLRFLNRLKTNEHLEQYTLDQNKQVNNLDTIDLEKLIQDSNLVDGSWRNTNCSKLEKSQANSGQVESLLIRSFLKSIISSHEFDQFESVGAKVVQILINNYSDIMRIPNDLITNFKSRVKNANVTYRENFPIFSTQETKNDKKSFKNFIDSSEIRHSQGKKVINSGQQNQKIKKALNILGLNDSISYPSLNQKQESDKFSKDMVLTANLSENITKNSQISFEQSFNQLQSTSYLNSSVVSNFPSKSSLFQSSSSINFPRIFSNKKWKKENLI